MHTSLGRAVIAASCLAAGAGLFATGNTLDFTGTGLALANPWEPAG